MPNSARFTIAFKQYIVPIGGLSMTSFMASPHAMEAASRLWVQPWSQFSMLVV